MMEKLKGGLADNMSLQDIANKHKVNKEVIIKGLKRGIKVEKEHTKCLKTAKEISKDHLYEDPKYYDKLEKIEAKESMGGDSSGAFDSPMFSNTTPIKKNITNVVTKDVEEATDGSSSGSYDLPFNFSGKKRTQKDALKIDSGDDAVYKGRAVQDKNFPKFGGPGGVFVKVKDKCRNNPTKGTREPNCNQGDINNLEFISETVRKIAKQKGIPYSALSKIVINEIKKIFIKK